MKKSRATEEEKTEYQKMLDLHEKTDVGGAEKYREAINKFRRSIGLAPVYSKKGGYHGTKYNR